MVRLLRDRYFAYDQVRGCDLTTGGDVRLDALPEPDDPEAASGLEPLIEVLDHAREGDPRWVVLHARNAAHALGLTRRAANLARSRGFVPVLAQVYARLWGRLAEELRDRTLLLVNRAPDGDTRAADALVRAAAGSPRPHVLLTFRFAASGRTPAPWRSVLSVREARAAYGSVPAVARQIATPTIPEIAHQLHRAARAADLQRAGRHSAADRLLRDVAAALARRHASGPAASVHMSLGRVLLERGRAEPAEATFNEAAGLAESAHDQRLAAGARLWQVAARTDAGRLTEAESLCRAVLLGEALSLGHRAWANAALARVLLWQGRVDEAARLDVTLWTEAAADLDEPTACWIGAMSVRVLLESGESFRAGQRARDLLTFASARPDPLPRAIVHTAHLRVLAAAGDLVLAEQSYGHVREMAREARAPVRAARARLIWYDALRRTDRTREAHQEIERLARLRRALPPLLRRAVEHRVTAASAECANRAGVIPRKPVHQSPIITVLLESAHEEANDSQAIRRIMEHLTAELQPSRVDLLSSDAGPASVLLTVGSGLQTHVGSRVLEAGIAIHAGREQGGCEVGVPVRFGARLVAALVCRWPVDREPPPAATELLEVGAAVAAARVDALLREARDTARAATTIPELLGISAVIVDLRRAVVRAASAPFAVLVEGESGVGKELVARAIHQLSARRERRFCDVNCAALPEDLLESELFGHARGAFTGAVADRAGLFEEADGGTLFLDELPDLSLRGQAKLLRVLQQQEVRRVGEAFGRKIDVRLVTATNREMREEVAQGRFRQDLLYRLDVIRISIPPLRERPEDVPVLAEHFWRAASARVGSTAVLTHAVLAELARYHWPGNVRELQNVVAALAVAAPARGAVRASLLPAAVTGATSITARRLAEARSEFERRCVEVALARAHGNRTKAAAELGLSRQGLLKTMARLGIAIASDARSPRRAEALRLPAHCPLPRT